MNLYGQSILAKNQKDLETAKKRIAELEKENATLAEENKKLKSTKKTKSSKKAKTEEVKIEETVEETLDETV